MSDLIDREALLNKINKFGVWALPMNRHLRAMYDCWDMIKNMSPKQSEIIRCGDCKWFQCNMRRDGYLPKGIDEFKCRHWCGGCDPTDYCSYAERRTDERSD